MNPDIQFIGIKKITRDKDKKRVFREETIRVKDIRTYRPWHKTENEKDIDGGITMIFCDTIDEEKGKIEVTNVLIHEEYSDFTKRLGSVVIVR